jgi:hypothetical protein
VQAGYKQFADEYEAAHAVADQAARYGKIFKEHPKNIAAIMEHYSPRNENPTDKLIERMERRTGINRMQEIDLLKNAEDRARFTYGIAVQEGKTREGTMGKFLHMFTPEGRLEHQRGLFGHPHYDLLGNARKAGLLEQPAHKVTGSASLSVDFKNMPRGVKTKTKIDGMFSQIRVARGRAMPLANQEG